MKIYIKLIAVVVFAALAACEADPNEGLPSFDNSLPLYVQLDNPSSIEAEEGEEVTITVELPKAVFEDVNVDWQVDGDLAQSGTVTIIEGDLNADVVLIIPDDDQPTGGGTAEFSLIAVDNGLSLGRPNVPSSRITTTLEWTDNDE